AHHWMKIGSVVRAAYQRTGGDVEKTFSARDVTVITELLRRNVFNDRQMFWSRAQILAHGQDLTAHLTQIVHRLKEFRLFFAQAEHHAALGDNTRSEFLRPAQNSQGRPILRARAYHWCEAFHRFHVVIINVRAGVEHDLDAPILRVEIGNEHFDDD